MTSRPLLRTLLAASLLALAGVGGQPGPAGGQEQSTLEEHELAYQAALRSYEAALAAREVAQSRFNREMREVRAAKGTDRADQAWDEFNQAQLELNRMDRRVERRLEEVEEAGTRLLAALNARRSELATRLEELPPEAGAEAEELVIRLADLRNEIDEVDAELGEVRRPLAPQAPGTITIEPDATQEDLRIMAQILEDRAARYDSTLVDLAGELDQLRDRQRTDRRVQDLMTGLDRFDDRALPVGPRRSEGGQSGEVGAEGEPSDTAAVELRELSLEARIENLEGLRERLVEYRNLVLEQARIVRERIGSGGLDWRLA